MGTEKLTLTDLQLIIRDSLYISLPDFYWVTAEIAEIKENFSGHCYLELIEKNSNDKNIKARIKAIIWGNKYRFLNSFFENATGAHLSEGMRILVKVKVEYHEIYGLSLVISDIDPAFTVGEMALKRQMIIKRLEEEGVFSMNKEIDIPVTPQRIAIISSENAAGYTDFINQLAGNRFGYVFKLTLFESAMQGLDTEKAVVGALEKIATDTESFDVVVIIRGGGSITDLSWFDNYNIAYYVTQFPLPVITGIGHEKDMSVTDMVANISLKTPTAVADFLIEKMQKAEENLIELSTLIVENSLRIIDTFKRRIDNANMNLRPFSSVLLANQREKLAVNIIGIINFGKEYILRAGISPEKKKSRLISAVSNFHFGRNADLVRLSENLSKFTRNAITNRQEFISGLSNKLEILNPENVLRRGYTISSIDGRIIKSCTQTDEDLTMKTKFFDGEITSRILTRNGKTIRK